MASRKQPVKRCRANKFHNYCQCLIIYIRKMSLLNKKHCRFYTASLF